MRTRVFLKTSTQLVDEAESRMKDSSNTLATAAQYQDAINDALRLWSGRVVVPHMYGFDFASGTYEYALPSYITPPFVVSIRRSIYGLAGQSSGDDSDYTWIDFPGNAVEPTETGSWLLRMQSYPYAEDGRILWFAENGPFPATAPTLNGGLTATSSSIPLTMTGGPDIGEAGYVRIDNEFVAYAGYTRTSDTAYTLLNVVRGLNGTTAATHNTATTVSWCVAVDDQKLWVQLFRQVEAFIHWLQLHKSTVEDTSHHEKMYSAALAEAENFWRRQSYVSQRRGRLLLNRGAMGPLPW